MLRAGAGVLRRVPGERHPEAGLAQRLAELGDHLGRGVLEPVEDAQHAGADVLARSAARRRLVPGQAVEVVALGQRQVQPLRDGGDHLLRGVRPALPLEPGVVVGRHVAQRRDLLTAQPAGPAALTAGEADVLGLQGLAAQAEELREPGPVDHHETFLPRPLGRSHGSPIP